jgi:hypothetical protein
MIAMDEATKRQMQGIIRSLRDEIPSADYLEKRSASKQSRTTANGIKVILQQAVERLEKLTADEANNGLV